jgi:hypothetical protein
MQGLFGGWRLVGINTMTSGLPVNLVYTPATAGTVSIATSPNMRPNVIGEVVTPDGGPSNYLDRTALETPPTTAPFGNAPRNSVRSPWFRQLDLGMHKTFDLGWQGTRLETRIEAFNLFNTTNFGAPNGNFSSNAFGTITTTGPARQIQLGIKLTF